MLSVQHTTCPRGQHAMKPTSIPLLFADCTHAIRTTSSTSLGSAQPTHTSEQSKPLQPFDTFYIFSCRTDLPWPLQDPVNALADSMSIERLAGDVLDGLPHCSLGFDEPLLYVAACSLGVEGGLQAQLLTLLTQHCSHLHGAQTQLGLPYITAD